MICYRLMDALTMERCHRSEDNTIHDPLGKGNVHVFSPYPPISEEED